MSQDELAVMDGGKCILQLRGVRPFLSDKYDITKHPNYPYTADADPKNAFDIEAFLSTRLKLKPNEVYDVYEVGRRGRVNLFRCERPANKSQVEISDFREAKKATQNQAAEHLKIETAANQMV